MHIKALYLSLLFISLLFAGTLYIRIEEPSLILPALPTYSESNSVEKTSCVSFGPTYESGDIVDMPCGTPSQAIFEVYRYDSGSLYLVIHGFDIDNRSTVTLKKFATVASLPDLYAARFVWLGGGERYITLRDGNADHQTMYYNEQPVPEIDWLTFSLVGVYDFPEGGIDISNGTRPILYSKDKNHVYYMAKVIPEADSKTFVFVPSGVYRQEYGKDKYRAYYLNFALEKSDPATFVPLGNQPYEGTGLGPYAKDRSHVYYKQSLIPEADAETFEVVISGYAKDKSHVYKEGKVIPGADPKTFKFPEPSIG